MALSLNGVGYIFGIDIPGYALLPILTDRTDWPFPRHLGTFTQANGTLAY